MFDLFKIKLFGKQPVAIISDKLLEKLIVRDYENNADLVRSKFTKINSDSQAGKNRISADILKLSDKNINTLDRLIEKSNYDSRDIIMLAEYPRCAKIGFGELDKSLMKQIFINDFIEYSKWLNK